MTLKKTNLKEINKLIHEDMILVDKTLKNNLQSNIDLINQLGNYIINGGGKRIRPIITLLSAKSMNYNGFKHIIMASIIEFIHTATLLHDDVIDKSKIRRGKATIRVLFGNESSILIGDFIYTKAFQMITDLGSMKILSIMSDAANAITEGEILQLINCKKMIFSEENYMQIIYSKTAKLFETAAQSSAIIADSNIIHEEALRNYGKHLGIAYQIIDDTLDYSFHNKSGKQIGNDLKEGKITLPLIHAMKSTNLKESKMICKIIKKGDGLSLLKLIMDIMSQYGSLEWTKNKAKKEAKKAIIALKPIKNSIWKNALSSLANILIKRKF